MYSMVKSKSYTKTEWVAALAAIALFLSALLVSSFHIHTDCATRDTCPICRFQESGTSPTIPTTLVEAVPKYAVVGVIAPIRSPVHDLFRFYPVYAHAPPLAG